MHFRFLLFSILLCLTSLVVAEGQPVVIGAAQTELYLPLLKNKRVAIFANQASMVESQNIVQFLVSKQVNVRKIFSPEHGFNGDADAGASVKNGRYANIPLISLYGSKTQPNHHDLADIDVIVFDIQDVGVRYYTYISSLELLMEAAAKWHKPLIILDRPNPNAHYIDGPVLKTKFRSFVGRQAIPIVYGMTIGEYASMLVGEHWLTTHGHKLNLTIIPLKNYNHNSSYPISYPPSPNLRSQAAIYLYPHLGWFEGTNLSVGRGTDYPFLVLGAPNLNESFSFTPQSRPGALNPPYRGQLCHGWDYRYSASEAYNFSQGQIRLDLLINAYQLSPAKPQFFNNYFDKLAGTDILRHQIIAGYTESEIRASWQADLTAFRHIRQHYLLYPEMAN